MELTLKETCCSNFGERSVLNQYKSLQACGGISQTLRIIDHLLHQLQQCSCHWVRFCHPLLLSKTRIKSSISHSFTALSANQVWRPRSLRSIGEFLLGILMT